jgi:cAMP phosphodiesterase
LINDSLLIDAGSVTSVLDIKAQQRIENILITHAHLDHIMGVATMADNLCGQSASTIRVWGINEVIASLKSSIFNDTVWPDFTQITHDSQPWPVLAFHYLREENPTPIGGLTVTMVRVNHIVPTSGFLIEDGRRTLLHVGDTGPTERVWQIARRKKDLCAVVLEASFPNRLQSLADMSRHLTPQSLALEVKKLARRSVPILVTHLKPQYRDEIIMDLRKVKGYRLKILKDGDSLRL